MLRDLYKEKRPDYEPEVGAEGLDAIPGDAPFILHEDGLGWIYVPKGLKDGPFPTHYEPLESPVSNELYSHDTNPAENGLRARRIASLRRVTHDFLTF